MVKGWLTERGDRTLKVVTEFGRQGARIEVDEGS